MGLFLALVLAVSLSSCAYHTPVVRKTSYAYSSYMKGLLNDRLGSIEEAVSFYLGAQRIDQSSPALHEQAGLDYIRLQDYKKAASEFEKVINFSPEDENARYVLALLYVQLNDFRRASGQYAALLERNSEDRAERIGLRRILSQLYFLNGDFDSARKQCEEVLKTSPVDAWALYVAAMIDSEQGRLDEAADGFKKVLLYYPDNAEAMNALAYMYVEQDIYLDEALDLAERALEIEPDNAAYLDTIGWIYFKLGDIEHARAYLKRASVIMLDPLILEHLKKVEDACKQLKQ